MAGDVSFPVPGLIATACEENKDNSDIGRGGGWYPCNNLASERKSSQHIYVPAEIST
jgi:hypothetical protein